MTPSELKTPHKVLSFHFQTRLCRVEWTSSTLRSRFLHMPNALSTNASGNLLQSLTLCCGKFLTRKKAKFFSIFFPPEKTKKIFFFLEAIEWRKWLIFYRKKSRMENSTKKDHVSHCELTFILTDFVVVGNVDSCKKEEIRHVERHSATYSHTSYTTDTSS